MKTKYKFLVLIAFVNISSAGRSQSTNGSSANNSYNSLGYIGWSNTNGTNPLSIRTNGVNRMSINGATGTTAGFVGIGTTNPLFQLSVVGNQIATGQGWTRGILLSNSAALMWDGGPYTTRNYFMAHSSATPDGDFYQGYSEGIGANAAVTYTSKVYVNSPFPGPSGSTQIFKWLVVQQDASERRFGVNTTNPFRVAEIKSNLTAAPQLRITTNNNAWTDLQTLNTGNFVILPQSGRVGINLTTNPTANLDVNGDARIRNVQTAIPNSLLVGVNASGASDVNVRRLDFPNDNTVALLGDGTWGPAQGATGPQGPAGPIGPAGPAGPAGTAGGATCGSNFTIGRLTANTRLNLSNNNYYFNNETSPVNTTYNRVAVGYNCTPTLPAKFNVLQRELTGISFNSTGSHAQNADIGTQIGQYFIGHRGLANGVQVVGRITNNGGYFTAANSEINYGVRGEGSAGVYAGTGLSYGGYFTGLNNYAAYGLSAIAINPSATGISYGIYAGGSGGAFERAGFFEGLIETTASYVQTSDAAFKTNVNRLSGSLKLLQALKPVSYTMDVANYPQMNFDDHLQFGYIAQDVENVFPNLVYESHRPSQLDSLGNPADSAVTYKSLNYNGFIAVNTQAIIELDKKVDAISLSDELIKTNVANLTGSLNKVLAMRGVSYDWDHTVHPELNLDSLNQVGFIAQEIQQIDSRLTFVGNDSLLHVKYEKVVPILAEAIEELNGQVVSKDSIISAQQVQIDDLNNRLSQLENCLSGILPYLCQLSQSAIQANTPETQEEVRKNLNVTLSNRNAIVLDQNVPNPFAEQTVINFSIPETVKKAQIHFYDGNGRFMNSVELIERGLGSVTVFGSDLSTGVYTYTLVADGQVVAMKKMIKQ